LNDGVSEAASPTPTFKFGCKEIYLINKKKSKRRFKMVKKLFFPLVGFVLLAFLFSFTMSMPLVAQEQEEEAEDVMDMDLEDLLNVEITTAGKKAEKISEIPASVVLVTREDIERYGYMSLEEVLENVPGVYKIDDMAYYGASFGMRGFWSTAARNVKVLVNGVHQSDGFWQTSQIENFRIPVEAIDRIEVIRGPMSIVYGSGAFFGAINIITNEFTEEQAVNVLSAGTGSLKTVQTAARLSGVAGDMKYAFNAGYMDTEGPDEPLSRMASDAGLLAALGINSTNDTTGGRLEASNKYFNLTVDYKGLYAKMSYSENIKENYIILPSVSEGNNTTISQSTMSFGYRKDLSDKWTVDFSLTYHKHSWWLKWDLLDPSFYGHEFGKSQELELDFTAIFRPSEKFSLTAGLHYQRVTLIDAYDLIPFFPYNVLYTLPDDMTTPSIFTQMDFNVSDKFRLVAGVRLEALQKYTMSGLDFGDPVSVTIVGTQSAVYDNDEIQVIPRFAAIYSINDKNIIKFLYGKAIRHPDFQPNLENYLGGAPTLNPEHITTFELNYIASPSPKLTMNLSLFYNELKNLIIRSIGIDSSGAFYTFYSNQGHLRTTGVEFTLKAMPFENFLLDLSGTYQKTKDQREGFGDIDVSYSPNLLLHLKASYKFGKHVTFAMTGRYVDKMYPHFDDIDLGARIGAEVDGYFTLDANLRIDNLFGKGYYINARCTNLFDTDFLYPTNVNNSVWADLGTIGRGLGRAFLVTFGVKW
jgi:outer membrane receptor protein involved in Fe transport